MSRASLSARVVRPRVFARATPPRDFRTPTTRREALLFPPFAATLGLLLARPPLASPREDDVRRFGAPGARPASSRRVVERPSARWTESPAALPNAETLPWHFSVPSEGRMAHLHRVPLTRGEEEIHSLDVLFRTPEGDRVGVSVWPLPPETPAETLRLTQVRAAVEATPLASRATPHARREDDPRRGRARDRGRQSQRESDPTPGLGLVVPRRLRRHRRDRSKQRRVHVYFEYDAHSLRASPPCRRRARCTRASPSPQTNTQNQTLFERYER